MRDIVVAGMIALMGGVVIHAGLATPLSAAGPSTEEIKVTLPLTAQERLIGAAAGNLTSSPRDPVLVFGTSGGLMQRGGLHVVHRIGGEFRQVWRYTSPYGDFREALIRDVNNDARDDLIVLWIAGQGGYTTVQIFEWN